MKLVQITMAQALGSIGDETTFSNIYFEEQVV